MQMPHLRDRNGNPLHTGDRVRYQISPRLPWAEGTVTEDGRVRSAYNGDVGVLWPDYAELAA